MKAEAATIYCGRNNNISSSISYAEYTKAPATARLAVMLIGSQQIQQRLRI
jgi:hypothetical protein